MHISRQTIEQPLERLLEDEVNTDLSSIKVEKELEVEAEQEIEQKMCLESEIENIHGYFTDDRRRNKRSQSVNVPVQDEKKLKIKNKKSKTNSQESIETHQIIIEAAVAKYEIIKGKTYYEMILISNTKAFDYCYLRFSRRYSQFDELKRRIKKILSTTLEFPQKRWTLFGISDKVRTERKNMLHSWIKYLFHKSIENEELMNELKKFVENENYPEKK